MKLLLVISVVAALLSLRALLNLLDHAPTAVRAAQITGSIIAIVIVYGLIIATLLMMIWGRGGV